MNKLTNLGLSAQKADETLKNEALTGVLFEIHDQASKAGPITKQTGNFLYTLGTKLPKQFHSHLPLLIDYIAENKINHEAKLTAAIKFIQDAKSADVDRIQFESACGIGVVITDDQIEKAVNKILKENENKLLEERYHFNCGPLLGQIKHSLKWADSKKIKDTFDKKVLEILGPKTEQDCVKISKKKEKASNVISEDLKNVKIKTSEKQLEGEEKMCTMAEFLKSVHFHAPGENHKTDGYVINEKTHDLLNQHLKITNDQVRTRFPPEPNGILHIGHAKAININFGYSKAKNGVCFLRYDDTNPEKEEEIFFKGIKKDVEWLGYKPWKITHSSDYFDQLFEWAVLLVKKDLAYVCHQKPEEVRGFDPPPSPWRNRDSAESLRLFYRMKDGFFDEGEATLRLKLTLEEGKVDPVAYRIKYVSHHRTGDKWCVYPTYDYTHCLCDSIEHITHSLCTKEFQNRRSSYYWLCNAVEAYCPVQWEYGRLNMLYTVVSKRKIAKLIERNFVKGWDDPRLMTLSALRRRGVPPEAVNNFCASLGLTGAQMSIHPDLLEACARDVLNRTTTRTMVILEPVKVIIENFSDFLETPKLIQVENIPGNPDSGFHSVVFDREIWIEISDFKESEEKGFRRLTPTQSVGLRHAGFILRLKSIEKDGMGCIKSLKVTCEPVSDENKPKAFIHWVSRPIECIVRLYERLFLHENPEDSKVVPSGFLEDINPKSLHVLENALADQSILELSSRVSENEEGGCGFVERNGNLQEESGSKTFKSSESRSKGPDKDLKNELGTVIEKGSSEFAEKIEEWSLRDTGKIEKLVGTVFQFERVGYFVVDPDSRDNKLVFNRTVALKEDKGKS